MSDVSFTADLDNAENIADFIDRFYDKVLNDEILRPIFVDVANIDLSQHLGHIRAYWQKLLLADDAYDRNTMEIHRQLDSRFPLQPEAFSRWLKLFIETAETSFSGPSTDKAIRIATNIAGNMEDRLFYKMPAPMRRRL